MDTIFIIAAALSIVGALNVVFNPNPIHGGLSLVGCFFMVGVIYVLMSQEFMATVQVLVYAGAIMVLFLFVMMLLNMTKEQSGVPIKIKTLFIGSIVGIFFIELAIVLGRWNPSKIVKGVFSESYVAQKGTLEVIGENLFTQYLLVFEVISLLLLVAVVGAVVIAKKKIQ